MLEYAIGFAEVREHRHEVKANPKCLLERRRDCRYSLRRGQRLLEPHPSILKSRSSDCPRPGLPEVVHGLLRQFAPQRMVSELLDLLATPRRRSLERLDHGAVQETSAQGQQPSVGDLPDSIVREIQLI